MDKELLKKGLAIRREVLGEKFVDRAMAQADDFAAMCMGNGRSHSS